MRRLSIRAALAMLVAGACSSSSPPSDPAPQRGQRPAVTTSPEAPPETPDSPPSGGEGRGGRGGGRGGVGGQAGGRGGGQQLDPKLSDIQAAARFELKELDVLIRAAIPNSSGIVRAHLEDLRHRIDEALKRRLATESVTTTN